MSRLQIRILALLESCCRYEPRQTDPRFIEMNSLPDGIVVTHSPIRGIAARGGRSGFNFTWDFSTTVCAPKPVRIVEFGAFIRHNKQWVFSNFTRKPFTAEDFGDWYSAPSAVLELGKTYTDQQNWFGSNSLKEIESLWYFIGVDETNQRVKGKAICTHLAVRSQIL